MVIQNWFKDLLVNISPGGAGRNRVMSKPSFLKLPCYIPPYQEQQKIAEILAACDRVINLKEQLLAEKRRQKKWFLEKLLDPNSGVRLPGFTGKWEKKKLGELGSFSKGFGISNTDCEKGDTPCIKYGDIYTDYNTVIEKSVSHTSKTITENSKKVSIGTLLFTGSGEDPLEIGKCVVYLGKDDIAIGGDIIIMAPKDVNHLFLAYQQYTSNLISQKAELAQGYSIVHIYADQIKSLKVNVPPTRKEQDAIANILFSVDNEITLLSKELEEWRIAKKALMQVLLTGIVRVNDKTYQLAY
jgi:type I restriction enzyme S subunit